MLHLLLLFACTGADPVDSAAPADTDDGPDAQACDVLEIRVNGEDPPTVGDTWTVFLWCDDALLTGTYRIFFDPPDFATLSNNDLTFLYAGEAELTVQAGSRRQTRMVSVTE